MIKSCLETWITPTQGLTGSRYPTRTGLFFKYPTRPEVKNLYPLGPADGTEGGEEILAHGRVDQSKVVQEVLADLKIWSICVGEPIINKTL